MYGNASFHLQRSEPSFVVPHPAVVTNLERSFVIRVREGKTEWIDIRNGISMNDKVEIFGDLQEGDQLLSKASDEIKAGQKSFPEKRINLRSQSVEISTAFLKKI